MRKNPVVMQVLPALQSGGVERGTVEIAKALTQEGWTSFVVSAGGPMAYDLKRMGVEHIELPVNSKNPFKMWWTARKLSKIIDEKKVDIVHVRSRAPAWVVRMAMRGKKNVKMLATFHGFYGIKPKVKKIYNRVMVKGELVISISNFITDHLKKEYHVPEGKIRLIHRGADVDKFDPVTVNPERVIALINKWRVPVERPVIMLPGRLTNWKGQLVLIEALSMMKNKDVVCLLVGSDQGRTDYTKELNEKIQKLNLGASVLMVDHCSDMPAAYMVSDIVVSASSAPEAFGRVIPEAQAMGRLVVGTNHGGATETIEDGRTGLLIPPNDPKALANALDTLLEMSMGKKKKMTADAMESVRSNFSVAKMCQKTLDVYKELAEK